MKEKKRDETQRGYALIRILGVMVLALFMLVSIAGAEPYAYITNSGDNTVSVIDISTNTVTDTVNVGIFPHGVAVTQDGTKVYVANEGSNDVSVIDTATNTVTAIADVDSPWGVAVNPEGAKVYATNYYSNSISVIDTATNTVTATVPVGIHPRGVAVIPDGTKVYVANFDSSDVSVIDTTTNQVTATINIGVNPEGVAINPDGTKVYVASLFDSTIYIIDTATDTVTATVGVGYGPVGVSVNPEGTKVYVANWGSNTVSVIDTATNAVIATMPVGLNPWGVSVSPDGSKVYVANGDSDTVSVIDAATNTVTATVDVGDGPCAVGQFIGSVPEPEPEIQRTQITTSGTASNPHIYGDRIVWEDIRDGKSDIYMYDLSTQQEAQISTSGTANYPAIYDNRIVWYDSRNGKCDVYMYDLSTQQETKISTSGTAYASYPGPDIYKDKIVWGEFGEYIDSTNLVMHNLSTQQETQITNSGSGGVSTRGFYGFALHGDKIVMCKPIGDDASAVYLYDISTSQETGVPSGGSANYPDIYGDKIVWHDGRNGDDYNRITDIYIYDLSTQTEAQISTSGEAYAPAISGNRIVWDDYRSGRNIYMYDLSNSKETQITNSGSARSPAIYGDRIVWVEGNDIYMGVVSEEEPDTVPPEIQITQITTSGLAESPDIYGDRIVWQDNRNGNWDIYTYDLSTSQETQITINESMQEYSAIYGDRIVWEDNRNEKSDIYMYDLSTQQEIQISTSGTANSPAIYGDRIVWVDGRGGGNLGEGRQPIGNLDIYLYDLSTNKESRITSSGSASNPAIYGSRIVWEDYRNGQYEYDIYMYDLSTQKETQITTSGRAQDPAIYGSRIVWTDIRAYPPMIYMYDLSISEETPVPIKGFFSYTPDIYDDRIVYTDERRIVPGEQYGNEDIYLCDLSTNTDTQITNSGPAYNPAIYGDKIVWVEGNDIYMGTLSYPSVTKNVQSVFPAVDGSIRDGLDSLKDGIADDIIGNSVVQLLDVERGDMPFEDRGIIEFDISKISGSVTNATLNLSVFSSNGPYPFKVDIFTYTGDGNLDLDDFNSGTHYSTFEYYGEETVQLDVTEFVENMVSSGAKYAAFNFQYVEPNAIPMNGPFVAFSSLEYPPAAKLTIVSEIFNEKPIAVLPVADFSSSVTCGYAPLSVQFTDLSTNATSWNWDFGDGTTSTDQNTTHTYPVAGTYNVNLTVSNTKGTDSKLATITVLKQPVAPVADFSASPTVGKAPLTVTFTDQSTGSPTSWSWKFGDKIISTAQNPEHIYSKAGKYTVSLTVKNKVGSDTRKISKYIIVKK